MTLDRTGRIDALREKNTGRLLLKAHRAFNELAVEKLRAMGHSGLSVAHASVLPHISSKGTRSSDVAKQAGMTKQSMSRLVNDLIVAGYLRSESDPNDARAALISFTPKGLRYLSDAHQVKKSIELHYAKILGTGRLSELRESLEKLIASGKE
jgi:DNA-binding MarR family transcriptional regulator